MAKYTYILSDFPNNKYNSDTLSEEIIDASLNSTLDRIDGTKSEANIFFTSDLSAPDVSALDYVVSVHTGEEAADAENVEIKGDLFITTKDVSVVQDDGLVIAAIDASGRIVNPKVPPIYYGQEFQYAADLSETTSTSQTPLIKVSLTTTDLPQGIYQIIGAWLASHSSTASDMRFDMTLDGSMMGVRHIQREPKDIDNVYSYYKVYYEQISGVHTIALRFWNENNSTTISDATIQLMRVK